MNTKISQLSDEDLIANTHLYVRRERDMCVRVLHHLKEVDQRLLWAMRGSSSLFDYVVREFKYSESQAYRRISAIRLMNEIPEISGNLSDGSLTLSNLTKLHTFLKRHEKAENREFSTSEKQELIEKIKNQTEKQVASTLAENSRVPVEVYDKVQILNENQALLQILVDRDLLDKMSEIRDSFGNQKAAHGTYNELLHKICDVTLAQMKPRSRKAKSKYESHSKRNTEARNKIHSEQKTETRNETDLEQETKTNHESHSKQNSSFKPKDPSPQASNARQNDRPKQHPEPKSHFEKQKKSRAHISVHTKRAVWERDQGMCTFVDPLTNTKCGSTFGIQNDHIHPFAQGGSDEVENLRLLCKSHNHLHAVRTYGPEKMQKYQRQFSTS